MTPTEHRMPSRGEFTTPDATNLEIVSQESASPDVQRLFQRYRAEFGRPQVPGILQCFATHPPLLDHMMSLAQQFLFVEGALGRENKELLSAFLSASNHCAYCADSHAYFFRLQGGSPEIIDAVLACDLHAAAISPKQRALLSLCLKVNEASETITRQDFDRAREAGWTDLQIAEAIHVTALFAAFNRVVNSFGLPSQNLLATLPPDKAHA